MQTPWMTPNDTLPAVRGRILGHWIALGINGAAGGGSSGFKVFGYLVLPTEKRPKASASGRAQGRQKYGREGAQCATRTAPSPATKATALAALATGESVSSVARRRGISRTTAARWRDEAGLNETTGVVHEKSGHG